MYCKDSFLKSLFIALFFNYSLAKEDNPYEGATGYIHGGFTSQVDKSLGQDSSISELAKIVKQQSTAIWLAGDNPDMSAIKEGMAQAKDKPIVMTYVVYNVIQDLLPVLSL